MLYNDVDADLYQLRHGIESRSFSLTLLVAATNGVPKLFAVLSHRKLANYDSLVTLLNAIYSGYLSHKSVVLSWVASVYSKFDLQ